MTNKTKAAEALGTYPDFHKDKDAMISQWLWTNHKQVHQALQILDLVQKGEAKVMRREPIGNMADSAAMVTLSAREKVWDAGVRIVWPSSVEIFEAMYDAAPALPDGVEG